MKDKLGPRRHHRSFLAWAVRLKHPTIDGGGLSDWAGRYYFEGQPAPQHEGCVVALFPTKRSAQAAMKTRGYCARVERVSVVIEQVGK